MRHCAALALAGLLAGCAAVPRHEVTPATEQQWQTRQQRLGDLSAWRLAGRVGVQRAEGAWNGNLRWAQDGSDYNIILTSPLGQGGVELNGSPGQTELRTSADESIVAEDAATLLERHFGWQLPVAALRYWVLGLPDPRAANSVELDDAGRAAVLRQSGWEIAYHRYTRVDGLDLPGKIFVSHPGLDVRLVVDRWDVPRG